MFFSLFLYCMNSVICGIYGYLVIFLSFLLQSKWMYLPIWVLVSFICSYSPCFIVIRLFWSSKGLMNSYNS
jgi:hypothetical protein